LLCVACGRKEIPLVEIAIEPYVKINELIPQFDLISSLVKSANALSIDGDGNLYFLDDANHRVLKYDENGRYLCQIGGIGQGNNDLIFPSGIYIYEDSLYVLDDFGHTLKSFSLAGEYRDKISIESEFECTSFVVSKNTAAFNILSRKDARPSGSLFIMISNDHRKAVGRTIVAGSALASRVFNRLFLSNGGNSVFGAHQCFPVIFRYTMEGREVYYRDLKGIREIAKLEKWGIHNKVGTPSAPGSNKKVSALIFCSGFAVDNNLLTYYAINSNRAKKGTILVFDETGNLLQRIVPLFKNKTIHIERILIQDNRLRVLFSIKKELFLSNIKFTKEVT
jgi:hypothetical protein